MGDAQPPLHDIAALTTYNKAQATLGHCNLLVKKDFSAIDTYFAEPYIQHNPRLVNGVDSLKEFKIANVPHATTTILRSFADRDLVFFHEKVEGVMGQPLDFWDLYRVEEGKIVEHWDAFQVAPGGPGGPPPPPGPPQPKSAHTVFDGVTESSKPEATEYTRARVLKLVNNVFVCRKYHELPLYVSPKVIQHAPGVEDGIEGWMRHIKVSQWFTGDVQYDAVRQLVVEGDFAVTCSQGFVGEEPYRFWDMWRLEGDLVVEHWNVSSKAERSRFNRNPAI